MRKQRCSSNRSRGYKGGSSASTYVLAVAGSPEQQYNNTFSQAGPYAQISGNNLMSLNSQNGLVNAPSSQNLNLIQSAGKGNKTKRTTKRSRRSRRTRTNNGGSFAGVLGDAIVPFGLLTMQQKYKNNNRHRRSHSRRRYTKKL